MKRLLLACVVPGCLPPARVILDGLVFALGVLVMAPPCTASNQVAQALREELKIQETLLAADMDALQHHQGQLEDACSRVPQLTADLIRAEEQGESLESMRLRDEDLRRVEAELEMHLLESHRLRTAMIAKKAIIDQLRTEVERLESSLGRADDPLSGTWRVVVEPGGQEGLMFLTLDGTLVQGTYQLEGEWFGSVRGTLVAGKVRLERVDSQVGFSAIYYGQLQSHRQPRRIAGRWEATQLATGLPSGGSWVAERVQESEE